MDDLQNMRTGQLLENYRSLVAGVARATKAPEAKRLSDKADLYEEEILRRMAW